MLHDLDVRFVVTPTAIDTDSVAVRSSARTCAKPTRSSAHRLRAGLVARGRGAPRRAGRARAAAARSRAVRAGERLVYAVTWDGPAGALEAGDVTFEVEAPPAAGRHRFAVGARTAPWVARFFEADDRFTTTTDDAFRPLLHERRIREGPARARSAPRLRSGGALGPAADGRRPAVRAAAARLARGPRRGRRALLRAHARADAGRPRHRSRSSKAASTPRSSWSRAPSSASPPAARRSRRGASRRAWSSASSAGRCRPSRCGSNRRARAA